MNIKNIIIIALVLALGFGIYSSIAPKHLFGTTDIPINLPMTKGGVLCGNNTSTLLIATSTSGRNYMTISNASAVAVFLGFGYSAAAYQGTLLSASSTITLDSTKSYTGAIYCLGLGATATTTYSDSNS